MKTLAVVLLEGQAVERADGQAENSGEESAEAEADAEDVSGAAAVAGENLVQEADGAPDEDRGACECGCGNQPVTA